MLLQPTKTLTPEEVREELERINSKTVLKGAAVVGGGIAILKVSPIVDGVIYGNSANVVTKAGKIASKFTSTVAFPYVASFPMWHLYVGAFTVIGLLIVAFSVRSKIEGESWGTIIGNALAILSPVVLWFGMDLIF